MWKGRNCSQRWPAIKRVATSPSAPFGTLLVSNKVITCVDHGELGQSSGLALNYHIKKNKADMRPYEPLCEQMGVAGAVHTRGRAG